MTKYENIRTLRKTIFPDLNMKQFCERSGISLSTMSNIERQNKRPTPETLDKIAEGLEIPVEMILWVCVKPTLPEEMSFKHEAYKQMLDTIFLDIVKQ